jgi:stress response protein SCP2
MSISLKRKKKPDQVINLQVGSTYDLGEVLDPTKIISVELSVSGQGDVDFACFSVDAGNRALEQFLVFHGQTRSPGNEISLKDGDTNTALFRLEPSRFPEKIKKLIFTVSARDSGSTLDFSGLDANIHQNNAGFHLRLSGGDLSPHKSVIAVELSLGSLWQLEVPATGFNGYLGDLVKHFGLEVDEDPSPDSPSNEPVVQRDGKIWIDGEEFIVDPENDWV